MKRIRLASALVALAVLAALAIVTTMSRHTVRAVYASTGCTDATLTGNYAVLLWGFDSRGPAKGIAVPAAAAGVVTFDGAGNLSTVFTLSINGVVEPGDASSGTYTVNSDCTGTLSLTTGDVAGTTVNFVIIGGGTEAFAVQATPGTTQTLDLKKQ